jgi:hypothetical protein
MVPFLKKLKTCIGEIEEVPRKEIESEITA